MLNCLCSTRISSLIYWPIHLKSILIRKDRTAMLSFFFTIRIFFFRWKSKNKNWLSNIYLEILVRNQNQLQTLFASHSLISRNSPSVCNTNNNGAEHFYMPKSAILRYVSLRGDNNSPIAAKDLKFKWYIHQNMLKKQT